MLTIRLAMQSLSNRRLTTGLTVGSIALSVALLIGVETVRRGVRENFAGTIRGTDLIVGARGGSQQLLLSTIFGLGFPGGAITVETYNRWKAHAGVAWTVPISLGDSWHGYRVMGTDSNFYEHYHYRNDGSVTLAEGKFPSGESDAVLGSEVAKAAKDNGIVLGSKVILTHGLSGTGISDHENHPFTVVGILNQTITPVDRTLFVTLDGVEGMHVGMAKAVLPRPNIPGAPPPPPTAKTPPAKGKPATTPLARDAAPKGDQGAKPGAAAAPITQEGDHDDQLTAFLVGMKTGSRGGGMMLAREMNTDLAEPLTAIIPAVALTELWHVIEYAESGARIITFAVLLVGLMGMLVALYSTLQERRREMAILRSLGAGPGRIAVLLVLESGVLAFLGAVTGLVLVYALLFTLGHIAETRFGIFIPITAPQKLEYIYLVGVIVAGVLVGLIPAWRAYRNTLQDGLAIRL